MKEELYAKCIVRKSSRKFEIFDIIYDILQQFPNCVVKNSAFHKNVKFSNKYR
jgi:hypothetical protein